MKFLLMTLAIILVSYALLKHNRYIEKERKAITKDIRIWNLNLTLAIIWLLIIIFDLKTFIDSFQDAYRLLIPDYFQSVYKMLDVDALNALLNRFQTSQPINKYWILFKYTREINGLYIEVMYLATGIIYLLRGLSRNYIYEDGIYTGNGDYKWEQIKHFKWSEEENSKLFNNEKKYYNLYFTVEYAKKSKFLKDNTKEIDFQIRSDDRQNVISILNKNK